MAQNTYKNGEQPPKGKKKKEGWLYTYLNQTIGLEKLFGEDNDWPLVNFNRIIWVSFLVIIYIGFNHNAEGLARQMQKKKAVVDELRAHYTTLQADFMKSGKQSEISKRVIQTGLGESKDPPYVIVVKPEEPK
ncbi:FtsL-like putative cell division protein [Tellurirhabdus bombi]|uniref:FtsL-like putative cell division protein n=1 Tax=Tellurirhabdus bombi TaxID=2907205 RepID=UPI001F332FC5|nr:FtsL-like putative cell division protein [Tellurirhabdus bombi]